MARRDFMPWSFLSTGPRVEGFPVAASMTIYEGEPVILSSGYLTNFTSNNPADLKPGDFLGIAAGSSVDVFGNSYPQGYIVSVWMPEDSTEWVTNVSKGSTSTTFDTRYDTADVTGGARVASIAVTETGKTGSFVLGTGALNDTTISNSANPFYVTTNASANALVEVVKVIDNYGLQLGRSSTGDPRSPTNTSISTGYRVVFRFL